MLKYVLLVGEQHYLRQVSREHTEVFAENELSCRSYSYVSEHTFRIETCVSPST